MSKLYELSKELSATNEYLEGVEENFLDEDQAIVKKQLDSLQIEFEDKVHGIIKFIKNLEAEVEMLDKEAEHFDQRAKSAKKKLDYLKNYLKFGLNSAGIDKLKVGSFRVSLGNSKQSVMINCPISELPMKFKKVQIIETPDKESIRAAIEGGEKIDGVFLVDGKTMRIF